MTKTEERKLKTALRRLEKCGGDCHHCEKCRVYSCYIVADTEEGIKKELAAVAGCAPSDIVMWAFDEFIRVPQYKAV